MQHEHDQQDAYVFWLGFFLYSGICGEGGSLSCGSNGVVEDQRLMGA
jgi:hypothetical protein